MLLIQESPFISNSRFLQRG